MEQLIILIIFYVLYALFNRFTRKLKGPLQTPQQRQRPGVPGQPPGAPATRPKRRPSMEEPDPELELPPFLKELFGMEEPAPPPPQPQQPARTEIPPELPEEKEPNISTSVSLESASLETFEKIKSLKEHEDHGHFRKNVETPAESAPQKAESVFELPVASLLRKEDGFKKAFILKEILDAPISKRPKRNPNIRRI